MPEGSKYRKITEGIKQGLSSFIFKNPDKVGELSVYDVLLSQDLRTAKVFISCHNISEITKLIRNKHAIYEEIKSVISSKYLPSIEYIHSEFL